MLSFDVAGFQRQFRAARREVAAAIKAAAEAGEEAVAERALEIKIEEVEKTYSRPPVRGTRRTGAWREGQRLTGGPGARRVETVGPAAAYEGRLATLRSARRNPAAANARARMESEAPQVFRRAVEEALRKQLG